MSNRLPTLRKVAEQLNIGPRKLFAELRTRKIIDAQNFAHKQFINQGHFKVEQRTRIDHASNRQISYYVTTVTDDGLFFLQRIANEIRGTAQLHGSDGADRATAEREKAPVLGGHRLSAVCGVSQ